jgi:hypothetical protein
MMYSTWYINHFKHYDKNCNFNVITFKSLHVCIIQAIKNHTTKDWNGPWQNTIRFYKSQCMLMLFNKQHLYCGPVVGIYLLRTMIMSCRSQSTKNMTAMVQPQNNYVMEVTVLLHHTMNNYAVCTDSFTHS